MIAGIGMSDGVFIQAARLLGERYGPAIAVNADGSWPSLVRTVLFGLPDDRFLSNRDRRGPLRDRSPGRRGALRGAFGDDRVELSAPLATPGETAAAHVEEIEESLRDVPRGAAHARVLLSIARWWEATFGDDPAPEWTGSTASLREELTALPGVTSELADRILLLVAGRPAWPVSRAAVRIACRHGWLDPAADHDEWQAYFTRMADAAGVSMAGLAVWLQETGREFCGPAPRCDSCPLVPLLPASGPIDPE